MAMLALGGLCTGFVAPGHISHAFVARTSEPCMVDPATALIAVASVVGLLPDSRGKTNSPVRGNKRPQPDSGIEVEPESIGSKDAPILASSVYDSVKPDVQAVQPFIRSVAWSGSVQPTKLSPAVKRDETPVAKENACVKPDVQAVQPFIRSVAWTGSVQPTKLSSAVKRDETPVAKENAITAARTDVLVSFKGVSEPAAIVFTENATTDTFLEEAARRHGLQASGGRMKSNSTRATPRSARPAPARRALTLTSAATPLPGRDSRSRSWSRGRWCDLGWRSMSRRWRAPSRARGFWFSLEVAATCPRHVGACRWQGGPPEDHWP